jgi:hypothetical protein
MFLYKAGKFPRHGNIYVGCLVLEHFGSNWEILLGCAKNAQGSELLHCTSVVSNSLFTAIRYIYTVDLLLWLSDPLCRTTRLVSDS